MVTDKINEDTSDLSFAFGLAQGQQVLGKYCSDSPTP
jgi:hypothetical protein